MTAHFYKRITVPPFIVLAALGLAVAGGPAFGQKAGKKAKPTGGPFSDYRTQSPGKVHRITPKDLPPPGATKSVDNGPDLIPRPKNAWPKAPAGFKVTLYSDALERPRLARTAPNGDIFVAESREDRIRVLRGMGKDGKAERVEVFSEDVEQPFGIAFYPPGNQPTHVYVANTGSVVRFPYKKGDLKASGEPEKIADIPSGGRLRGGGHWTRDVGFSPDGKRMFVSVGSRSNNDDTDGNDREHRRADILVMKPDGSGE